MQNLGTLGTGERVRIHFPERRSTEARVPNPTLFVGERRMTIDADNLPGQIARLLPTSLVRAPLDNWKPFIAAVAVRGLLR